MAKAPRHATTELDPLPHLSDAQGRVVEPEDDSPAVSVTADGRIRQRRFDAIEQAEIDGDPRFEIMLDPDFEDANKDSEFIWAHTQDVKGLKGRGGREVKYEKGSDGKTIGKVLACGVSGEEGETVMWRDHVLIAMDRSKERVRKDREVRANREMRANMIRKENNKTHYLRGEI